MTSLIQSTLKFTYEKQPLEATDTSQLVFSGHSTDHQDTKGNKQHAVKGLASTKSKDGTHKSKLLPEGTTTYPKDSEGHIQLVDIGFLSTSDEAFANHSLYLRLNQLMPDTQREIYNSLVACTGSLATHPDEGISKLQPFLEETLTNPKDSRSNIQLTDRGLPFTTSFDQSRADTKYQVDKAHSTRFEAKQHKESDQSLDASYSESSSCFKTFKPYDNYVPIIERVLAKNLKGFLEDTIKEDPSLNKSVLDVAESYTKNTSNLTELLTLVKDLDSPGFKTTVESLQAAVTAQNDHLAKWAEGQPFSTSSKSVPKPTLTLPDIHNSSMEAAFDTPATDIVESTTTNNENFFIIAVQTPGSGIFILLAVGTPSTGSGNLYYQWELSPGSGNALCILFPTLN
nr:hypothetical protein [Tanacetum cinerariifolium]